MDNKEIIVIEDRLYRQNSVVVEFVTPEDVSPYNHVVVNASAKKFAGVLHEHLSSGFCTALARELGGEKMSNEESKRRCDEAYAKSVASRGAPYPSICIVDGEEYTYCRDCPLLVGRS